MSDFADVFRELRGLFLPYAKRLIVRADTPTNFYLDTHHIQKNRRPLFFGAVQVKKSYVSVHLFPIYVEPSLLDDMSLELRARMQGKSCFNFTTVDKALVRELGTLTRAGYAFFRARGFVK